jgi:SAM-dependent methyltransferase
LPQAKVLRHTMNHPIDTLSPWVARWTPLIAAGGRVLDVACGSGRHARALASIGYLVVAVDRDGACIEKLAGAPNITAVCADLEGDAWPFRGERYAGVVVTNYLHRPLLPTLVDAVGPGGVLIYETFAAGNERYGRPSNPDFLLRPGELLDTVRARLRVVAYEDVRTDAPKPALVQRICAVAPAVLG